MNGIPSKRAILPFWAAGKHTTARQRLVLESSASGTAVVHAALGDDPVGASGARGNVLPDDRATVAEAELGRAVADDSTLRGASSGGRAASRASGASGATARGTASSLVTVAASRGSAGRASGGRRRGGDDSCQGALNGSSSRGRDSGGRNGGSLRSLGGRRRCRLLGSGGRRARGTTLTGGSLEIVGAAVLEVGARVGEFDCLVQGALAGGGGNVRLEHIGKGIETGSISSSASDIDRGAVHVELWSTRHFCEPGPGESTLSIGDRVGEGVLEGLGSVNTGAATLNALDNLEHGILGGSGIGRVGKLARATSVDGAAVELKLLRLTDLHAVHLGDSEAILALAGELLGSDGSLVDLDLVG